MANELCIRISEPIIVTIAAPPASGKTRMFSWLEIYCRENNLSFVYADTTTEAAIRKIRPSVIFKEAPRGK